MIKSFSIWQLTINSFSTLLLIQFLGVFKNLLKFYLSQKFLFWKKLNRVFTYFSIPTLYLVKTNKFFLLKFKNFDILYQYKLIVYNNFNFFIFFINKFIFRYFFSNWHVHYYFFVFNYLKLWMFISKPYLNKNSWNSLKSDPVVNYKRWQFFL